jgi:glucose/arabinose dehydrogenase
MMQRVGRLLAFGVVASVIVVGLVLVFRGQLMRLAGVSFDIGTPGRTNLQLPSGIRAEVFAQDLAGPRFMAFSPDGVLVLAERDADRIVALPDRDADGHADETIVVGSGFGQAHSLAFADATTLLVPGRTTLYRVTLGADLREGSRTVFYGDYPGDGAHTTRTVLIRADGGVLLSVGSSCNVCEEADDRRAAILAIPPEGGSARVVMRGLRNAVGLAADPATGTVWATDMGRDLLSDDIPPETLYRVEDGAAAGSPRCHAGTLVDPDFGRRPSPVDGKVGCDGVVAPAATFQAHAAPLGLAFWGDRAVIAFHGSWNRSSKVGYEVDWLPWADGPAGPPEPLATGFLDQFSTESTGRPAGLVVGPDGALYLSDDKAGFIYRLVRD